MSEEILINITPTETRVALLQDDELQEVHIEYNARRGINGNIYRGRVVRVLPGMEAAFVDIGLERNGYLHVTDLVPRSQAGDPPPAIGELLHPGQTLSVQVTRHPVGTKGARLSTQLSIPSRYVVLLPAGQQVGVSMRIDEEAERERLRERVTELVRDCDAGGYIVRTNAEGSDDAGLATDIEFLQGLWQEIQAEYGNAPVGTLVYEEPPLYLRVLRDMAGPGVARVLVDSKPHLERAVKFMERFHLNGAERLEHYAGAAPIFDLHDVESEIQKALERRVPLQSGGSVVIEPTEAMTTIDVNTGGFVGHRELEQTLFRTNLEAAQAIARQLRLRNLGGIIIIDFIDMEDEEHKQQLVDTFQEQLEKDPARTRISRISPLGLVEMTRKRSSESLEQVLCEPCPDCAGRATVKTIHATRSEILREIQRASQRTVAGQLLVLAAPEVVASMSDWEALAPADINGKTVRFQVEEHYRREQFDVVAV